MKILPVCIIVIATLLISGSAAAQVDERRVRFAPGTDGATVAGEISGDLTIDYLLNARAGQTATVSMTASTTIAYFNLIAPSETDVAFFVGSMSGDTYSGSLPESGDYRVRVYLLGNQAPTTYRLELMVTDSASDAASPDQSTAYRAGHGGFDATGEIPCAQGPGQPMLPCAFGVARNPGGEATIVVTRPDGTTRALLFEGGAFLSADTSQADGYPEYSAAEVADLNLIRVGDERCEGPVAAIVGG